ncbi:hypothetical protein RJ641_021193 [Dillenia turbinata]|uniref:Ribosomal protein L34e superfamily protein n=1 Tax=Dillenia turbinata TaxID=194707 RepID=A0AAN8UPW0_9MAGN
MRHFLFYTMPISSPHTKLSNRKFSSSSNPNPNSGNFLSSSSSSSSSSSTFLCKHSPSATLDILILLVVLFAGAFLIISYFSYIFQSLSLLFFSYFSSPSYSAVREFIIPYVLGFIVLFTFVIVVIEMCCGYRSRKCMNPGCKGLKKAMEFDLQLQTEECVKSASSNKEIDRLPWKGGSETNPDYECLRSELRKMAPPNGRAVLLFRAKCGCPVAKLEGWAPKRGKRHKKSPSHPHLKLSDTRQDRKFQAVPKGPDFCHLEDPILILA